MELIVRSLHQGFYIPHKDPEWEADEDFYNYRYLYHENPTSHKINGN
jgi:hypothetical protein